MSTRAQRRRRRAEAGFTMIEVMMALALTAIAILGILSMYTKTMRSAGFSRHTTEATALAEDKIEQLRTISPAVGTAAVSVVGLDPQGLTGTGGIYTRTYSITMVPSVSPIYANVQAIVSWSDDGSSHSVTVNSRRDLP
jgi:prepilin-type N-terminal cleavage/methylation domain-containing protein